MATAIKRPVQHDDRLSLTEHLDELRSRLIVCAIALLASFGFTFWQNEAILGLVNKPLEQTQNLKGEKASQDPLEQNARFQVRTGDAFTDQVAFFAQQRTFFADQAAAAEAGAERERLLRLSRAAGEAERSTRAAAQAEPANKERQPVTLGVAEPFTTTITVALYAALLIALPIILFQLYAFILPAFAPGERKIALPLMALVPFLFVGGVSFGYFVVLPRAIGFLQNFNDDDFDILIQAREYYKFAVMFVGSIGLLFQIPIVVIAIVRLRILTPKQLRKNRGYVLLALSVLAAVVTPTPDPVTMLLATIPLYILFEASILLAAWLNRVAPPGTWWGEQDEEDAAVAYHHED